VRGEASTSRSQQRANEKREQYNTHSRHVSGWLQIRHHLNAQGQHDATVAKDDPRELTCSKACWDLCRSENLTLASSKNSANPGPANAAGSGISTLMVRRSHGFVCCQPVPASAVLWPGLRLVSEDTGFMGRPASAPVSRRSFEGPSDESVDGPADGPADVTGDASIESISSPAFAVRFHTVPSTAYRTPSSGPLEYPSGCKKDEVPWVVLASRPMCGGAVYSRVRISGPASRFSCGDIHSCHCSDTAPYCMAGGTPINDCDPESIFWSRDVELMVGRADPSDGGGSWKAKVGDAT
jgi:hypothetical protein